MDKKKLTKAMTLGGIFAAIYMILTLLSVYVLSVLSVFGLIIMPIFAAYYASIYRLKETIIFNIATIVVCFICSIGDPFFVLLYILPTLFIGDLFGVFNRRKIKYYATLFLQSLAYSLTNYLAILLAQKVYETNIISIIFPSASFYQNWSLCILFILSGAEAVVSTLFVSEELAKLKIIKEREKEIGIEGIIAIFISFIFMFMCSFFSNNFMNFFFLIGIILSLPLLKDFMDKIHHKEVFLTLFSILMIGGCFYLSYLEKFKWIIMFLAIPFFILDIANLLKYLYNKIKDKEG